MKLKKGWIKTSKLLPKINEEVLMMENDGDICSGARINKDEFCTDDDWLMSIKEVYAWKRKK